MWSPPPAAPAQVCAAQLLEPRLVAGTWGLCPSWRTRLPLSQLQLQPVNRYRHRDTEDTDMADHTDKVLPSAALMYRIHIQHKHSQPGASSLSAGRERRSLVVAHTPHSLGSQAHTYLQILWALAQPLCFPACIQGCVNCLTGLLLSSWSILTLAANTHHTGSSLTCYTLAGPPVHTSTDPLLSGTLSQTWGPPTCQLVHLEICCWIYTHRPHTRGWGTIQTLAPLQ